MLKGRSLEMKGIFKGISLTFSKTLDLIDLQQQVCIFSYILTRHITPPPPSPISTMITNRADPDEILRLAACHLGLQCLIPSRIFGHHIST